MPKQSARKLTNLFSLSLACFNRGETEDAKEIFLHAMTELSASVDGNDEALSSAISTALASLVEGASELQANVDLNEAETACEFDLDALSEEGSVEEGDTEEAAEISLDEADEVPDLESSTVLSSDEDYEFNAEEAAELHARLARNNIAQL